MEALGRRNDGGVADQRVVDTRVRDQVRLELVEVDIESAIEAQRRSDGRDDLRNQAVEVLIARPGNVQIPAANVEHGLVINQEGAVRVLDGAVGGKDSVVWLDDRRRETRRRVDGELQLALLAVIGRQTLEEEGTKTGTSTTTERVEDEEALEGLAVVYSFGSALRPPNSPSHG